MAEITLQEKVNRGLYATFFLVAVIAIGSIYGYWQIRKSWSKNQIAEKMLHSAPSQIESLIPSFLLQEQKSGVALILDRIKGTEGLDEVSIVNDLGEIKNMFPNCNLKSQITACLRGDQIAIVAPIRETETLFGYLVKTKRNESSMIDDSWVQTIEFVFIFLLIAFAVVFWVVARVLSTEVPRALSDLLRWIESDLNGSQTSVPELKIKELCDLRIKISAILESYEQARDQAVIGQLTSGIMHDIKTPLSSIVTATMLVAEQAPESPKRMSRLENLFSACQARIPVVGAIIESTLDGSRDIHIKRSMLEMSSTVQEAIELNAELISLRRAELELRDHSHGQPIAHDPVQILRVITNLIKNSLEAIPSGTKPKIRISIDRREGAFMAVSVDDNGPGLSGQPSKVFRVFRSTKSHGSGLGLLVSRKIVKAHGGELIAQNSSQLGGARFEVLLPLVTKVSSKEVSA